MKAIHELQNSTWYQSSGAISLSFFSSFPFVSSDFSPTRSTMNMNVIFEPQSGKPFSLEVDCFDSVLEMKEKIEKYQGISTSKQTLFFNGQVLQDDLNVLEVDIFQNSRIQLIIAYEAKKIQLKIKIPTSKMHVPLEMDDNDTIGRLKENIQEMNKAVPINRLAIYSSGTELQDHRSLHDCELYDNSEIIVFYRPPPTAPRSRIQLKIKTPRSKIRVPFEMDVDDTIGRLKEIIQVMQTVGPINQLVIHSIRGTELQDHRSLRECGLYDNSEISVSHRQSPTASASGPSGSKKLKLMVLSRCGTVKIPVEVNESDNVEVLRKELQKLHQTLQFPLPQEGYFFIHKQGVMDEDKSFWWHHVGQGDTIEVFNGFLTRLK